MRRVWRSSFSTIRLKYQLQLRSNAIEYDHKQESIIMVRVNLSPWMYPFSHLTLS
jgi:hypothetical protein